jgi:hypothetical protein
MNEDQIDFGLGSVSHNTLDLEHEQPTNDLPDDLLQVKYE